MKKVGKMVTAFLLCAVLLTPEHSTGQCSSRIAITDNTFLRCNGINYTSGILELKVDSLGLWINEELAKPFIPFVDRISNKRRQRYRETPFYKQMIATGLNDRDALVATVNAEQKFMLDLEISLYGIDSREELDAIKSEIISESLAQSFELELDWNNDLGCAKFQSILTDSWLGIGCFCGPPPEPGISSRRWDQELPRLLENYCKQLAEAEIHFKLEVTEGYRVVLLGACSGVVGAPTKEELLGEFEKD